MYDDTGAIGKLYRRQDEIGTPWCITVDFQSLEDKTVTVRDRDSMQQERAPLGEIGSTLLGAAPLVLVIALRRAFHRRRSLIETAPFTSTRTPETRP